MNDLRDAVPMVGRVDPMYVMQSNTVEQLDPQQVKAMQKQW